MPLLQTPFFMNAPQYDDFEIMFETDNLAPSTPAQLAFVNSFQPAVLALIDSVPAGTGVYSSTCLMHCLSGQTTYDAVTVNGISMSSALNSWFFDGAETKVVSSCTGWDCVNACGVTYNGLPCNMGVQGCTALQLPTSLPGEPGPASAPQPGQGGAQGGQQQQQGGNVNMLATVVTAAPQAAASVSPPVAAAPAGVVQPAEPALDAEQQLRLDALTRPGLWTSRRMLAAADNCCGRVGRAAAGAPSA